MKTFNIYSSAVIFFTLFATTSGSFDCNGTDSGVVCITWNSTLFDNDACCYTMNNICDFIDSVRFCNGLSLVFQSGTRVLSRHQVPTKESHKFIVIEGQFNTTTSLRCAKLNVSVRITARDVKIHDIHFQDCCNIYVNYDTKLEIKNCKFINSSVTE